MLRLMLLFNSQMVRTDWFGSIWIKFGWPNFEIIRFKCRMDTESVIHAHKPKESRFATIYMYPVAANMSVSAFV